MTLRELIEQASNDIGMYKHPNITEAKKRLDEILTAAHLGGCEHDTIDSLDISDDTIQIETSWYARGCENSSSYSFPSSILDAADPIKAATIWGLETRIADKQKKIDQAKAEVKMYEAGLAKLNAELEAAML